MPFTWVKPLDLEVLAGRPLLDLGVGDGQTHRALVEPDGLVVGTDRALDALGVSGLERRVGAEAGHLPFADGSFATALAADLFHHLDRDALSRVLAEAWRVLGPGGCLVAWWYEIPGRGGPGDPAHPRSYTELARSVLNGGFAEVEELPLTYALEPAPPTVGLVARRQG